MSHSPERIEKDCLNCGAIVHGRYCHICGQENLEVKQSAWALVHHFFSDITHFDGRFFSTTKYLIAKPGFLSKEFVSGRRVAYLNPIRMYVFTSAVFFLIFFSMFNVNNLDIKPGIENSIPDSTLSEKKESKLRAAMTKEDSLRIEKFFKLLEKKPDFPEVAGDSSKKANANWNFSISKIKYKSKHEYDSLQARLPVDERDGWLKRLLVNRNIELTIKYKDNSEEFLKDLLEKFMHSFPYLLFVSLPLYALFLELLYWRRKSFYYADHGIFLVHLYIFSFILLLSFFGFGKINDLTHWKSISFLQTVLFFYGIYYTYRAMKNFYGQGFGKTFLKFMLLNMLAFISLLILFSLFFLLTVFRI